MMIYLTVGLHEQPFDRIVQAVDSLEGYDTVIQYGYSTPPMNCEKCWETMPFDEIKTIMQDADAVVTHGGTGSIVMALSVGKVPVVAPRYKKYGEHVDDHQMQFVSKLGEYGLVVPFKDGDDMQEAITLARQQKVQSKNMKQTEISRHIQSLIS